jgi:hypothetical protein
LSSIFAAVVPCLFHPNVGIPVGMRHRSLLLRNKSWLPRATTTTRSTPPILARAVVSTLIQGVSSFQSTRNFALRHKYSIAEPAYQGKYTTASNSRIYSTNKETSNSTQAAASFAVPTMGTDDKDGGKSATSQYSGYEKWVRRLYATNMFHPVKLGLENMKKLHELLGNPMDDVSTVYPLL